MDGHITAQIGLAPTATLPLQAPLSRKIGSIIDSRYELSSVLGEGGHGIVYKARQLSTDQVVAIKLLRPSAMTKADLGLAVARFDREMRLIALLKHPNVIRLIDSGRLSDGSIYTVLELIEGEELTDILEREGSLQPREAKRIMGQVLDALSCAHQMGIVHRDLKPENIMLTTTGARRNAMVLDFGIAALVEEARPSDYRSLTAEGQINGTPHYMAPEQLLGERPTPQTDLYAWGLILAETLCGDTIMDGATVISIISRQINQEAVPLPPVVRDSPLCEVIECCVAKDLRGRHKDAASVLRHLDSCYLGDETDPRLVAAKGPSTLSGGMGLSRSTLSNSSSSSLFALVAEGCGVWLDEGNSFGAGLIRALLRRFDRGHEVLLPAGMRPLRRIEKLAIIGSTVLTAFLLLLTAILVASRDPEGGTQSPSVESVELSRTVAGTVLPVAKAAVLPLPARSPHHKKVERSAEKPAADDEISPPTVEAPVKAEPLPPRPTKVPGTHGSTMAWIDGGLFTMGLSEADHGVLRDMCGEITSGACDTKLEANQQPAHVRDLASFRLDTTEVTNADYQECVSDKACPRLNLRKCEQINEVGLFKVAKLTRKRKAAFAIRVTASDLPVACVNRVEAATFCHWANKRLPTEAEWEHAASAGGQRLLPWGPLDERGTSVANGADKALAVIMQWDENQPSIAQHRDAFAFAAPAGSFPEGNSSHGLHDLAGNVREWVSDPYESYAAIISPDPSKKSRAGLGVVRGGGWTDFGPGLSTKSRRSSPPTKRRSDVGFRCARSE